MNRPKNWQESTGESLVFPKHINLQGLIWKIRTVAEYFLKKGVFLKSAKKLAKKFTEKSDDFLNSIIFITENDSSPAV